MRNLKKDYSEAIADRIKEIMRIIDLDVAGVAELFGKSTSHIYGIINGTRPLSESFAREIGEKLGFDGSKIFNLTSKIPSYISNSEALSLFKKEYKENPEYFLSTKAKRSTNSFVNDILLKSDCFSDGYKYLYEITEYCENELNTVFVGDKLSKALQYSVKQNTLKSTKKPIKLKNGKLGKRLVDVYYL
jgi:plasmid maintenance system antidote protein VapI